MASFKFILRFKNSKTTGRIFLQYGHDSKNCLISSGRIIERKFWDFEKGKYKKHTDAALMNEALDVLKAKVNKVVAELQTKGAYPSPDKVKAAYEQSLIASLPEQEIVKSMPVLWKDFITYMETTPSRVTGYPRSPDTIRRNENNRLAFIKFLNESKIGIAIKPENFTIKHFHQWEQFLLKNFTAVNTRSKAQKHFKAFLSHHKKQGGRIGFSLDEITYKELAGHKFHIDEQELTIIEKAKLIGAKDQTRDLIILGCHLGLRISDFKRIDKNIQGDSIILQMQKTGRSIDLPIVPKVKKILEKYDYKMPRISEPVFRRDIKALYKDIFPDKFVQVKVNGEMTTLHKGDFIGPHSFIRTFVSISEARGMTPNEIAGITGKSISVLIKHYLSNSTKERNKDSMTKTWGDVTDKKTA